MALTKHKIDFDSASPAEHDRIGSFVIGKDGAVVTSSTNGGVEALDVKIDGTVAVSATDLDIRQLVHTGGTPDSVQIGDGTEIANVNASNELQVRDDGANTLLGAIDTDTSTIAGAVSGTEMQVDIVASLPAGDNNIGNVDVVTMPGIYVEDAASAGGENMMLIGGVRQDAGGSPVSADGDYHGFIFNSDGELKTTADLNSDIADDAVDSGNPVKIGGQSADAASGLSALSAAADRFHMLGDLYRQIFVNDSANVGWSAEAKAVSTTAVQLDDTKQAGRKAALIQNLGDKAMYIGPSNAVTTASGILLPKDSSIEFMKFGPALDVYAIGAAGASAEDLRIAQFG